ncbi:golgin subfamily A member 5 [Halyomorpha halys]|uniref:golgin subfamily A member 5 n=1 Tax=Halyomorpha halys TaxID=286706 RepID=UPI0006D4E219|nr:golgin subfamily A member 5 [Halyomorpha halys]XP_014275369.1 golgin subfamily A member 5 [Halyomorpha halys]
MSWINEIAGKAEDFLNRIDSGAATVLNKDKKKKKKIPVAQDVFVEENNHQAKFSPPALKKVSPKHNGTINLNEEINHIKPINEDDKLIQYLNNSSIDIDALQDVTKVEDLSMTPPKNIKITIDEGQKDSIVNLKNENEMLRNEVRSLSSEISLLLNRTKSSEREMTLAKSLLSKKEGDSVVLEKEIASLKQKITNLENDNAELCNENMNLKKSLNKTGIDQLALESVEAKLSQCQLDAQQKEEALKGDIASLRIRVSELEQTLLKDRSEGAKELSEANVKVHEARKELEEYRKKAQWTLSEKDKLINELKKQNGNTNAESFVNLELQQSSEEKAKLFDELEDARKKLENARKAELEAERRLETVREEAVGALRSSQARLAEETARRLAAEEHSASHAEELHSVREELWRQVGSLNSRLKERERELTRLRKQLSERVVTRPEPELTAALVQKQETIEHLTVELSQMRLHLERVKASYGQDLNHRQSLYVNDTDDAKAQLPSFMMHTPFDRSVRKAYSCVEAISRCIFLRRHPFTRIILFCYLVVLHLWLCLVLFFSTPESKMQV